MLDLKMFHSVPLMYSRDCETKCQKDSKCYIQNLEYDLYSLQKYDSSKV